MAITATVNVRTPNMLRYAVVATTASSTTALTQAQVVAACASGALKQYLQGLTSTQFAFLTTNAGIDISNTNVGTAIGVSITTSGGLVFTSAGDMADGVVFVTFRFIPSADR